MSASSGAATTTISHLPFHDSDTHAEKVAAEASPAATRNTWRTPPFSMVCRGYHTMGWNPTSSMHRGAS